MKKTEMIQKMIAFYNGNLSDIEHFLKVYAYAALIGQAEGLDDVTQDTLEIAAIVHDIACPLCREKYGNTQGQWQEAESAPLLRTFMAEFPIPSTTFERVIELVCHHHTVTNVLGIDHQILLEADFLVNAAEMGLAKENIRSFRDQIAKTTTGKNLLNSVYQL